MNKDGLAAKLAKATLDDMARPMSNKDDVAGLVERLRAMADRAASWWRIADVKTCTEAAEVLTTLSARVETLEAGMSQYLKDGQTPLERMEQDQADILGLMKLLQKEKELTEKLRWALSDAVTTNTESCRERDAALHRIEAAAKAERDRIVAWLREMGSIRGGVADAIEALEHLEEKQP